MGVGGFRFSRRDRSFIRRHLRQQLREERISYCRLTEEEVAKLMQRAHETPNYQLTVDLEQCEVRDDQGFSAKFPVDDFVRHCLLNGLDDIGLTLQHEPQIASYEKLHPLPSAMQTL